MDEARLRRQIVELSASLFTRGFSVGSAGNISARLPDGGFLITPTNSSLGRLEPSALARLGADFRHIDGEKPSKEVFMHRAFYAARPEAASVVHLHSTYATAVSCLPHVGERAPIPPLTPYFIMRIGPDLPVIPYHRPGDPDLEQAVRSAARQARAVLLANHGSVVSGATFTGAVAAAEELEEAAKLSLVLRGSQPRPLSPAQIRELTEIWG